MLGQRTQRSLPSCPSSTDTASNHAASSLIARLTTTGAQERTAQNIDLAHSSCKAQRTTHRLTGRTKPIVGKRSITANSIASQLVNNGTYRYAIGDGDMARHR